MNWGLMSETMSLGHPCNQTTCSSTNFSTNLALVHTAHAWVNTLVSEAMLGHPEGEIRSWRCGGGQRWRRSEPTGDRCPGWVPDGGGLANAHRRGDRMRCGDRTGAARERASALAFFSPVVLAGVDLHPTVRMLESGPELILGKFWV